MRDLCRDKESLIAKLRATLKSGGSTVGTWMQIQSPSVAEILAQNGYDWVTVDMEHGGFSPHQLPNIFRAIELRDCLPLARIAEPNFTYCKQALDAGAAGVIIPMVTSAKQLVELVKSCKWPPAGNRGIGFSRANLFGKYFEEYKAQAQNPLIVAMIENQSAVNEIEEILSIEGLDAILIGPYDLSASLGCVGDFESEKFVNCLNQVRHFSGLAGVALGIHIVEPKLEELKTRISEGYQFIAYGIDALFLQNSSSINPGSLKAVK